MSVRQTPWPAGAPCWLDLMVPDVARARRFYAAVTKWTFVDTGPAYGHFQMCRVGGSNAAGIGATVSPVVPSSWTVYFASDDVEASAELILENGGTLILEPIEVGDVCRVTVARDRFGAQFGVFEAGSAIGLEVVHEPGALVWQSGVFDDVVKAREFYGRVFGHGFTEIPPLDLDVYGGFTVGGELLGGLGDAQCAPEGTANGWTAVIAVTDVDAAVATAAGLGGSVLRPAEDTPFGRMSTLVDPFGAVFAVQCQKFDRHCA
jgi:hypothetical protein